MSRLARIAIIAAAMGLLAGCANARDRLIERSSGKPGWVDSDRDYWEESNKAYFRGTVDRQATLDLASERAKYTAIRKVNEAVYTKVLSAFGENTEAVSNDIDNPNAGVQGSALRRELAAVSKAVMLQGITQEASYWEKYETTTRAGENVVAYKVFSLVSIPQGMLKRAQIAATESGLRKVNGELNEAARASVQKSLDQLKQELAE
jgi:hypothetical protein